MALQGKICVITGAAGNIGKAVVERFLEAGAVVVGVDRVKGDHAIDWQVCDLGDPSAILALEQYLKDKYGRIDCLVNNAGLGGTRDPFHEKTLDEFDAINRVNIRAPFLLMQAALRLHLAAGESSELVLLNLTSIAATRPEPLASLYSMSRVSVLSLSHCVAREYARRRVRSIAVSPGFMEIPNIQGFSNEDLAAMLDTVPAGRGGQTREVANTLCWLASDEASYINGAEIKVDGGYHSFI